MLGFGSRIVGTSLALFPNRIERKRMKTCPNLREPESGIINRNFGIIEFLINPKKKSMLLPNSIGLSMQNSGILR